MAQITKVLKDSVTRELDDAVKRGELSLDERTRIEAYAEETLDSKRAAELEEMIQKDIDGTPDYSDVDELKAWRQEKNDLWKQLKDIKEQERACNQEIAAIVRDYRKNMQDLNQFSDPSLSSAESKAEFDKLFDKAHQEILGQRQKLTELTYEKTAIGIMHAEAKSKEAQINAQIWKKAYQPVLDTIQRGWSDAREYVKDSIKFAQTRKELSKEAYKLQSGLFEELKHKSNLNKARREIESMNKANKAIRKAEEKLMKAAKPKKRDLAYQNILNKFGSGRHVEPIQIGSVEQAEAVLAQSGRRGDIRAINEYRKAVSELTQLRNEHEANAKGYINEVKQKLDQRREAAFKLAHEVQVKDQAYELGRTGNDGMRILSGIDAALEDAFIDPTKLDPNVLDFIENRPELRDVFEHNFDPEAYAKEINDTLEREAAEQEVNPFEQSQDKQSPEWEQMSFFDNPDINVPSEEIEEEFEEFSPTQEQ